MEDLLDVRRAIDETAKNYGVLKANLSALNSPLFRPEYLNIEPRDVPATPDGIAVFAQGIVENERNLMFESMVTGLHFMRAGLFVVQAEMELSLRKNENGLSDCLQQDVAFLSTCFNDVSSRKVQHDKDHAISSTQAMTLGQLLSCFGEDLHNVSCTPEKLQSMNVAQLHESLFTLRAACASFALKDANIHMEMVEARQKRIAVFEKGLQTQMLNDSPHVRTLIETDKRACGASLRLCARHLENVESFFYGLHAMGTGLLTGADFNVTRYASLPLAGLRPDYT